MIANFNQYKLERLAITSVLQNGGFRASMTV
jgi:hypothetical protein